MDRPDFEEMTKRLDEYSQNLKDNNRLGDSKLILAFKEMIRAMGWSSTQQDTNNNQVGDLTNQIKSLRNDLGRYSDAANNESKRMRTLSVVVGIVAVFQLLFAVFQYKLAEVQIDLARDQVGLQNAAWAYEQMRNDRIEARDVQWRREDLEFQKRLPTY